MSRLMPGIPLWLARRKRKRLKRPLTRQEKRAQRAEARRDLWTARKKERQALRRQKTVRARVLSKLFSVKRALSKEKKFNRKRSTALRKAKEIRKQLEQVDKQIAILEGFPSLEEKLRRLPQEIEATASAAQVLEEKLAEAEENRAKVQADLDVKNKEHDRAVEHLGIQREAVTELTGRLRALFDQAFKSRRRLIDLRKEARGLRSEVAREELDRQFRQLRQPEPDMVLTKVGGGATRVDAEVTVADLSATLASGVKDRQKRVEAERHLLSLLVRHEADRSELAATLARGENHKASAEQAESGDFLEAPDSISTFKQTLKRDSSEKDVEKLWPAIHTRLSEDMSAIRRRTTRRANATEYLLQVVTHMPEDQTRSSEAIRRHFSTLAENKQKIAKRLDPDRRERFGVAMEKLEEFFSSAA